MKIGLTYEKGEVFSHFGKSKEFKIYTVENGKVTDSVVMTVTGEGHGALAGLLASWGVNVLICGGIGQGAREGLRDRKIEIYPGVTGNCDMAVEAFLGGKLQYDPEVQCTHKGHHH